MYPIRYCYTSWRRRHRIWNWNNKKENLPCRYNCFYALSGACHVLLSCERPHNEIVIWSITTTATFAIFDDFWQPYLRKEIRGLFGTWLNKSQLQIQNQIKFITFSILTISWHYVASINGLSIRIDETAIELFLNKKMLIMYWFYK